MAVNLKDKTEAAKFRVYIGFGGAGGKVLAALSEDIARDFEFSKVSDRAFSFYLVDTDMAELEASAKAIEHNLGRFCTDLMVETIPLGSIFHDEFSFELVNKFKNLPDEQTRKKLAESWWLKTDGRPLVFPGIINPIQGSSQMPLASRIMAWWNSEEIKKRVAACVLEYKRRHDASEGDDVDMYFVSSLAGGTGRGCWSTLAFMFREEFRANGIIARPIGLFIDAGCFAPPTPPADQQARIRLNSLTGVSELRMWLKNAVDTTGNKKRYVLPSLFHPLDDDLAVVDNFRGAPKESQEPSGRSAALDTYYGDPVDNAVLFFKGNRYVPFLRSAEAYYDFVGQTLYAIARCKEFQSFAINNSDGSQVGSAGASTAAVPADQLLDYIKSAKQAHLTGVELQVQDNFDARWQKAWQKVAIESTLDAWSTENDTVRDALEGLAKALESDKLDDICRKASELDQVGSTLTEALALGWHKMLFGPLHHQLRTEKGSGNYLPAYLNEPGKILADGIIRYIMQMFVSGSENTATESAPSSSQAVEDLGRFTLVECLKAVGRAKEKLQERPSADEQTRQPGSVADLQRLIKKLSGKEHLLYGKRFNAKEKAEIQTAALNLIKDRIMADYQHALPLAKAYALARLTDVETLLHLFVNDYEQRHKLALHDVKQIEGECFVKVETWSRGQTAEADYRLLVPADAFDTESKVRHLLRLPMTAELRKELDDEIEQELASVGNEDGPAEAAQARRALDACEAARRSISEAALEEAHYQGFLSRAEQMKFRNTVSESLDKGLHGLEASPGFIERHFALDKVVERLAGIAADAFATLVRNERERLREEFLKVFGFDLESKEEPPTTLKMCCNLAAYLAGNCHPFVELEGELAKKPSDVSVFLPAIAGNSESDVKRAVFNSDAAKKYKLEEMSQTGRNMQVHVLQKDRDANYNPFVVFALSVILFPGWEADSKESPNLGGVASLNYWCDEKVKQMLTAAEIKETGRNLATGGRPDLTKNGGIGFLDPRFVTDSGWRSLRWRPWSAKEAESETVDARGLALAYACLGNFQPETGEEEQLAQSLIAKLAEKKKWQLPLLAKAKDGNKWTWARTVYKPKEPSSHTSGVGDDCSWKKAGGMASLWKMAQTFLALSPKDIEALNWEIAQCRQYLASREVEASPSQLEAFAESVNRFLKWLMEEDVEKNYDNDDDQQKKDQMNTLFKAASNASSKLFENTK